MSGLDDAKREYLKAAYTTSDGTSVVTKAYADAAIAELEAELTDGCTACKDHAAVGGLLGKLEQAEAERDVAIELVTMARQTFDADGNGTRFLSEIREDVIKDVKRLAKRGTP